MQATAALQQVAETLAALVEGESQTAAPERTGSDALSSCRAIEPGSPPPDGSLSKTVGRNGSVGTEVSFRPRIHEAAEDAAVPAQDDTPAPGASPAVTMEDLTRWLARRSASVRRRHMPCAADVALDGLAEEIGERLELLEPFLLALRRAASSGRARTLHLRDESADTVGAATALGARLHELGLLAHYRYERSTRQLHVRTAEAGASFLASGWLQRWVAACATSALARADRRGLILRGVELQLADGQAAELDVVIVLADEPPIWIACRCGGYQDRLDRDVQLRRALGLDPDHAVIVLAEASATACLEMSAIHGLSITTVAGFEACLDRVVCPSLPPAEASAVRTPTETEVAPSPPESQSPTSRVVAVPADVERIQRMLRQSGLRPHPDARKRILEQLLEALADGVPRPTSQVKRTVAEAAGVSRTAVNDLLNALARGGALQGPDGARLRGMGPLLCGLATSDLAELTAFCLRAWEAAITALDPTLLETSEGRRALTVAIGVNEGTAA